MPTGVLHCLLCLVLSDFYSLQFKGIFILCHITRIFLDLSRILDTCSAVLKLPIDSHWQRAYNILFLSDYQISLALLTKSLIACHHRENYLETCNIRGDHQPQTWFSLWFWFSHFRGKSNDPSYALFYETRCNQQCAKVPSFVLWFTTYVLLRVMCGAALCVNDFAVLLPSSWESLIQMLSVNQLLMMMTMGKAEGN